LHHETTETRIVTSISRTGVVISEILPDKLKVAKSLKRWEVENVCGSLRLLQYLLVLKI